MASTTQLVTFLSALAAPPASTASGKLTPSPVSSSLLALLTALNTPSHRRTGPLRPLELAQTLAASSDLRRRLLGSSEQQDAHELWGMIVDAVDEELVLRNQAIGEREQGKGKERALDERLRNPYIHLLAQRVACLSCGYTRDIRLVPELLTTIVLPPVVSLALVPRLETCLD